MAKPLPWAVVVGLAALAVAALGFFTLYLPARQTAQHGNVVRVDGLTVRLTAQPDAAYSHGVDLDVTIDPAPGSGTAVEVTPSMPTMGNMVANVTSLRQSGPGAYRAVSDLGMGGLWEVQVTVHRPGQRDAVGRFRVNA